MRLKYSCAAQVLLVVIVSLCNSGVVGAEVLTLDQCIDTALKNNYGVIAAGNSYYAKRANVYVAWASILPSISISTSANQEWPVTARTDQFGRLYSNKYRFSGVLDISVSYPGLGLGTYASIKQSYHDRGSSYYSLQGARSSLVLQVKENYYNVLKAKMLMEVAQDAVKRSEEGLRVAQSRFDLGSASMSDVLKARVQFGNDKLDLLTKTNALKSALANLAFSMGADVTRDYEVEGELPETTVDMTFDAALNEAISHNPDFRKSYYDLRYAEDQRTQSYSAFLPSLTVGVRHSTSVSKFGNLPDMEAQNAGRTYFASMNLNIFNNFGDYATMRAARRNVETYRENLDNTRNSVTLQLKQAFLDLEQAREAKDLSNESVAAAQEDLNLVKEKYTLGAATILEVLDAEVSLKQAQTNQVQSKFDYNLAVSRLEKAMGR